jgi:GH24 family phage-related lysozyme (muramidase)/cell wall-associated NlpC family hydrolase
MKDLKLKIIKWDNSLNRYYLEDYCTSIKLSNSFSQIAAQLNFTIPYATLSSSLLAINVEMGDMIILTYKDNQIFAGAVIDTNLKGKAETLTVTCYDYTWWIVKSNITRNFNNISVRNALEDIYKSIGATYQIDDELGDNGNIVIKSHLVKNKQISKVLYAIYSEVTKATKVKGSGVYYYMHTEGDGATITITEADKYFSGITIQAPTSLKNADGNLIDYEIDESMANMITRIEFNKTTGEVHSEIGQGGTISLPDTDMHRYGVIQDTIEIADDDSNATKALAEGNKKLSDQGKPSEELTVTCFGDIGYKVAHGVMVKIPNTNYYDRFMYIVSSDWTWNNDGTFISKLTLSPSKNQNLEDWTSIEEKQEDSTDSSSSSGGSSDLVNRIIAELKKYLGMAYVYGGQSPAAGGMDCSGYISYVYNQFSSELEIPTTDGKFYPPTEMMMNQGEDVTSDFPDNLKECDIVFPHSGHVQAYIGNGNVIHSPQSGDVIKISDLNRNKIAKVIRVVPDSAWTSAIDTTTTSDTTTSNGKYSSQLVEFTKGWEGFVSPADDDGFGNLTIGYGTTSKANPSATAQGTCTETEADGWLKDEMNTVADAIQGKLGSMVLPQNQFDVLCDMGYNMGPDGFNGLISLITNGFSDNYVTDYVEKIKSYNHANGAVAYGLTRRCNARADMWTKGDYSGRP